MYCLETPISKRMFKIGCLCDLLHQTKDLFFVCWFHWNGILVTKKHCSKKLLTWEVYWTQTSLKLQYALNFQTCPYSLFSFNLHDSPIFRYQIVVNLKPVCSTHVSFHPVLRSLLGHTHFFDSSFDMCIILQWQKTIALLLTLRVVFWKN